MQEIRVDRPNGLEDASSAKDYWMELRVRGVDFDGSLVSAQADEDRLIEAARLGDDSAFLELWGTHSAQVFQSLYRILGNREDAEDALQDTCIKTYIHLSTFKGASKFSTWVTRIGINNAIMIVRKKRKYRESSLDGQHGNERESPWEIPDNRVNIHRHYETHEALERLKVAINHLPPGLREVVVLQQTHDCSYKELASLAKLSVPAVKSRLLRARNALRSACT
jgi:RNA polymerase sigma-70 factor (ECF subfamily)